MVILFAGRVVLGKSNFTAEKGTAEFIPESLRQKVADKVLDEGFAELVPVELGGTLG